MLGRLDGPVAPASRWLLAFAALMAIAVAPLFLSRVPPLLDYPNHLARMAILSGGGPPLGEFYAVDWRPLPNLAMDAVVPLLACAMPLEAAGKCFVALTLFLLAGGAAALHRALFGRWSPWPLLAFLLLYNRVLIWGFLNFLFGIGLCLVAFALWIALRERGAALRIAIFCALALLLYLAHLFALGGYTLLVGAYELGRAWASRVDRRRLLADIVVAAAQFVAPAALFLLFSAGSGGRIEYGRFVRKFDLFFTLFNDYNLPLDAASFAVLLLALVGGLLTRSVVIHPAMRLPLAALLAAHFALPSTIFTANGVDHRLPVLFGFVLVAGSDARLSRTASRSVAAALVALFLVRMGVVASNWRASDAVYAAALGALDRLPAGSRLAVAHPPELVNIFRDTPPLVHLPALAVVASGAFVPTLFAYPFQQPIALRPAFAALAAAAPPEALWSTLVGDARMAPALAAALCRFDFIAFVDRRQFRVRETEALTLESSGGGVLQLFRVRRAACP